MLADRSSLPDCCLTGEGLSCDGDKGTSFANDEVRGLRIRDMILLPVGEGGASSEREKRSVFIGDRAGGEARGAGGEARGTADVVRTGGMMT